MVVVYDPDQIEIREVWGFNLQAEMFLIRRIADDYPYIAMDTEFPGTVFDSQNIKRRSYEAMKLNVNTTKLIQLGLTFSNSDGLLPTSGSSKHSVWQFNFREFDPNMDPCAPKSIDLLVRSGIDFEKNMKIGVDVKLFRYYLTSKLVINKRRCWITFHGASDFGYMLKILTGFNLPETRAEFIQLIDLYFPVLYDIKHLFSNTEHRDRGLNSVAEILGVNKIGTSHLAGWDSLLTSLVFMKLKENCAAPQALESQAGVIFGIE